MATRSRLQFSTTAGTAEVVISAGRSGCLVVFALFWLTIWGGVGLTALGVGALSLWQQGVDKDTPGKALAALPWLGGWLVGLFFMGSLLLWTWRGREVLTVGAGELRIQTLGGLFKSDDTYALAELYELRVRDNNDPANQGRYRRDKGAILFDYGFDTVEVADDLPEEEARQVVAFLRRHRVDGPRR